MKELTKEELHDRQVYYQGYLQCWMDFIAIAREYIKKNDTRCVFLEEKDLDDLYKALDSKVNNSFDKGFMFYNEETWQLDFKETFEDGN